MKFFKYLGAICALVFFGAILTGCSITIGEEPSTTADKVSEKGQVVSNSALKAFDNKKNEVTFRPDTKDSLEDFMNGFEVEGYEFYNYILITADSNINYGANSYYLTYKLIKE